MEFIIALPILFFSVVFHEYAHGYTAFKYGDDTAYLMGRLSFNPIVHIDPVGTVLVPLLCLAFGFYPFGWAKPVPVNYYRLRSPRVDMGKVAFAGPASNIFLAIICALGLKTVSIIPGAPLIIGKVLLFAIAINLILAIFNLIPVPPLDGSKILAAFLPQNLADSYMRYERFGMIFVILLLFSGGFRWIVSPVFNLAFSFLLYIIGVPYGQYGRF